MTGPSATAPDATRMFREAAEAPAVVERLLGVIEVAIAILLAVRPFSPRASALGSALAVGMFLTTLSFLVTTPGVWEPSAGGFPALSALPGQFLIKDLALLGISLWSLGESWKASVRAAA